MHDKNLSVNASLSTMWAIKQYPNLIDFYNLAKQFGFQKIELNHQVDSGMLSNIHLEHIQCSSVHEPCPADISTKELIKRDWLISSEDEFSRQHGVEMVRRSINLAEELGAPVVVVHSGNVLTSLIGLESLLRALYEGDETNTWEYQDKKQEMINLREKLAAPRIEAVKKSLRELLDYAAPKKIKLGLENRYHFLDIPSIDEMGVLLAIADEERLGFIYDVGHALAMDRLGFYRHEDWLTRYASRMLGCHLHDVIGLADHLAPGLGEVDYKKIAPYLPENAFRTLEILPSNTFAQVKRGLELLIEAGCVSNL